MTRTEFDEFIAEARARGFTHVETVAGPQPLELWRPYGAFDGANAGIEEHIGGFQFIEADRAAELACKPGSGGPTGVWRFIR